MAEVDNQKFSIAAVNDFFNKIDDINRQIKKFENNTQESTNVSMTASIDSVTAASTVSSTSNMLTQTGTLTAATKTPTPITHTSSTSNTNSFNTNVLMYYQNIRSVPAEENLYRSLQSSIYDIIIYLKHGLL